jgi:hypothetical protein
MGEKIEIGFFDTQPLGALPEPVTKMANLVTKAAMGGLLAYFSLNELLFELKKYRSRVKENG